ncbi:MAG TPA: apolipoprotein N-acyltransferase, partial [Lacipirellulaceae bacterium]|nr:apolipoprotein N-acyltransferase [Lacipirellulaceae bacterium]
TQVKYPLVLQIADLGGEYAVTFLIVLVSGAIAAALPLRWAGVDEPRLEAGGGLVRWRRLAPAAAALAAALGYGAVRIDQLTTPPRTMHVALVQSDMLADWKGSPDRDRDVVQQQMELSQQAARRAPRPLDLIVWPETMYREPLFVNDEQSPPPRGSVHPTRYTASLEGLAALAQATGAAVLVGIDRVVASAGDDPEQPSAARLLVYNSAALVDPQGRLVGSYDKMHLLPFGEYIPLVDWLPVLRRYSPITGNSLWGSGPAALETGGVIISPSICYETVLPHLIRRQTAELTARGQTPELLVNLTNDAWYWGSSELDMHLASGVLRAVEMRTPLLIAANRGLSAHIDAAGRVAAVTERDRADVALTTVELPPRRSSPPSIYARWGDWLSTACVICCGVLAALGVRDNWRGAG